jgi:ABC-2 type transport system permease protein
MTLPRLLALDLLLLWRGSILLRTRRHVWVPLIVTLVLFQAGAYAVAGLILRHPIDRPEMLLAANINLVLLAALMLSRAITTVVDMLYARADADFLFSTPAPAAAILASRMISAALAVAAPWVMMAGMLGIGLALHGALWGLAAAPMLLAIGGLAAALAFALVLALVGRVPPQTARRAGHSVALFLGLGIFLLGQAPRLLPAREVAAFWAALLPVPGRPASWLAAGLLGAPLPWVTGLAGLSGATLLLWALLARRFSAAALTAATHRSAAPQAPSGFPAGPARALLARNRRLIWRFPGLLSQTIYRALALVALGFLLAHPGLHGAAVAPLLCFVTGQLAMFFIAILRAGEDAPGLLASAPIGAPTARLCAMAAAGAACLIVIALPAAATLTRMPWLALPVLAAGAGALLSALSLGYRMPMPVTRAAFGKPPVGTLLGLVLGTAAASFWAGLAWLTSPTP